MVQTIDLNVLTLMNTSLSIVSLIGSACVIICNVMIPEIRTFNHRLVMLSSISVCIASIAKLFPIVQNRGTYCFLEHFFITFGDACEFLWLTSIACTLHMVLSGDGAFFGKTCCRKKSSGTIQSQEGFNPTDFEIRYHVIIWTCGLLLGSAEAVTETLIFYYPKQSSCRAESDIRINYFKLGTRYTLWIGILIYNFYVSAIISEHIRILSNLKFSERTLEISKSLKVRNNNDDTLVKEVSTDLEDKRKNSIQILQRLRFYPSILCFCQLFGFIDRVLIAVNHQILIFGYLRVGFSYLMSFAIPVLFFSTPHVRDAVYREFNKRCKWKRKFKSGADVLEANQVRLLNTQESFHHNRDTLPTKAAE